MSIVKSYDEFLNEAVHIVKRKYTEMHPERKASDYAPVRERVLSFVKEHGRVTATQMKEFFRSVNEETGRKTSLEWVKANSKYFVIREKDGEKTYTLSAEGRRIHEKLTSIK